MGKEFEDGVFSDLKCSSASITSCAGVHPETSAVDMKRTFIEDL